MRALGAALDLVAHRLCHRSVDQQKIRRADEQELELRVGAWIDPELLAFLRQAVVALDAG